MRASPIFSPNIEACLSFCLWTASWATFYKLKPTAEQERKQSNAKHIFVVVLFSWYIYIFTYIFHLGIFCFWKPDKNNGKECWNPRYGHLLPSYLRPAGNDPTLLLSSCKFELTNFSFTYIHIYIYI